MSSTLVQLGYPGEYLPSSRWSCGGSASSTSTADDDAYTDKVGGGAIYCAELPMPQPSVPLCKKCQAQMFLIAQMFLPHSSSSEASSPDRHLYVFGCNKIECCVNEMDAAENGVHNSSFRVLRLVVSDEAAAQSSASSGAPASFASPAKSTSSAASSTPFSSASKSSSSASVASTSASSASSVSASFDKTPIKKTPTTTANEFGAASWSSDEDEATPAKSAKSSASKSKSAQKSAANDETDDLASLLAAQSLMNSNAAAKKQAADTKAAEKAAAKAKKQMEKLEAQEAAREELRQVALQARGTDEGDNSTAAAASSSSSSSAASSTPTSSAPKLLSTTSFRPFYLAWSAEPNSSTPEHSYEMKLLREYERQLQEDGEKDDMDGVMASALQQKETSTTSAGTGDDEDEDADKRDEEQQEFFDRIERMPTQCVRYYGSTSSSALSSASSSAADSSSSSSSSGLIFSSKKESDYHTATQKNKLYKCAHCGSQKVLELQLMPNLLYELHADAYNVKDPGMDWTTLDIYTCPRACVTNQYVEEVLHLQPPL